MTTQSYKINDSLYLVHQTIGKKSPPKVVEVPTNHVAIIDCSGSMYSDLPKIREQLKRKVVTSVKKTDTMSIIWFSGRGQCGTLLEAEPVSNLSDLKDVNAAIDRWLHPVGLTGFKDPLVEAVNLVNRVSKKKADSVFSLFFMSDGCDNQWSRPDILKAVESVAGVFASSTFVEYGYYADRPLLASMAEKAGGTLIFADDFDKYAPVFEAAMQKKVMGGKRVDVKIDGDPVQGFAFAVVDGDLCTYEASSGKASVPESLEYITYLSSSAVGTVSADVTSIAKNFSANKTSGVDSQKILDLVYAAVSLYSVRMKPDVVYPLLKGLGDVKFIEQFSGCFGKQKYSDFMDASKLAALGQGRFEKGWDPNKVPRDDAFTVLDVLNLLSSDPNNMILLDHEKFRYSRIGRGRVDASTVLTADEQKELAELTDQLTKVGKDVVKAKEISARIATLTNKPEPLKFVADPMPGGYPVRSLVYNEEKPNISFMVRKTGKVDISKAKPDNLKSVLPDQFETFVYRNYAVIKDGLVNVDVLPVRLSESTLQALFNAHKDGRMNDDVVTSDGDVTYLNLKNLPIVNRNMVKNVSAKQMFLDEWDLTKVQASAKVYNAFLKDLVGTKKSDGFVEKYGPDAANWLKDQGFTDYSGFGPKTVQAESVDVYKAKEMSVSIKSFSSIPSLNDFKKQLAKGKLTPSASIMEDAYNQCTTFMSSPDGSDKAKAEAWLQTQVDVLDFERRKKLADKARQVFSIIVGQTWFTEFQTMDENSMTLTVDGRTLEFKCEQREIDVKI